MKFLTSLSFKKKSKITINGQTFEGQNIVINDGNVEVDGNTTTFLNSKKIIVNVYGDAESVHTQSGDIKVNGTVGSILSSSGDVDCRNVLGDIQTSSGDVNCSKVSGNIRTFSGDITKSLF